MISVLIPKYGRPWRSAGVLASLKAGSRSRVQPIFLCSPGDEETIRECAATGAATFVVPWEPGPGDYAKKINYGLQRCEGTWVFTGADDLCFCPDWDVRLLVHAGRKREAKVIGTNDLWNPAVRAGKHSTHTLVHRGHALEIGCTWDQQPGLIYHEGYDHQYVDNELVAVAKQRQVWEFCKSSKVEHLHPMARKSEMDDTYRKGLANGNLDRRLFEDRKVRYGRG